MNYDPSYMVLYKFVVNFGFLPFEGFLFGRMDVVTLMNANEEVRVGISRGDLELRFSLKCLMRCTTMEKGKDSNLSC